MRRSNSYTVGVGLGIFAFSFAAVAFAEPSLKAQHGAPIRAGEMAPEDIIRQLYADYMSGDKIPNDSAEDKIRPYASRALQRAIDKENRCKTKSREICAIDFDYIIAGQDWGKLFDFHIDRSSTLNGLVLRVRFREKEVEPSHHVVTYSFVREDGVWRVDDVDDDGGTWKSLKDAIESYFKEYGEDNNLRHKPK